MKNKVLVRIDEKLLHAQIMLMWAKKKDIKKIILVDNELSNNDFLIKIYELSMPPYITIEILSTEDFFLKYGDNNLYKLSYKLLVIIKSINLLEEVLELGMTFKEVQIGFTKYEHLGKEKVIQMINKELNKYIRNVYPDLEIYYQNSPKDTKIYFN